MSLIKCPECGKSISSKATSCPQCGCPVGLPNEDEVFSSPTVDPSAIAETGQKDQAKRPLKPGKMILIFIVAIFAICFILSRFAPSGSSDKLTPGELEAVTYAQITVKEYYPNAELKSGTRPYTVVATGLRYKVEGKATINGLSTNFTVIIKFDNDDYDAYTIEAVQIGNKTFV